MLGKQASFGVDLTAGRLTERTMPPFRNRCIPAVMAATGFLPGPAVCRRGGVRAEGWLWASIRGKRCPGRKIRGFPGPKRGDSPLLNAVGVSGRRKRRQSVRRKTPTRKRKTAKVSRGNGGCFDEAHCDANVGFSRARLPKCPDGASNSSACGSRLQAVSNSKPTMLRSSRPNSMPISRHPQMPVLVRVAALPHLRKRPAFRSPVHDLELVQMHASRT